MYLAAKQMWWGHCICKNSSWGCFHAPVMGTHRLLQIMDRALSLSINRRLPAAVAPAPPSKTTSRSWPPTSTHTYKASWDSGVQKKEQARNMATSSMLRTILTVVLLALLLSGESRGLTSLSWKQNLAPYIEGIVQILISTHPVLNY
jgi:hypothetical protein